MPYLFTSVSTVSNRIICITKPIDVFDEITCMAVAEKVWNETNLQEVTQDWMFQAKFGDI